MKRFIGLILMFAFLLSAFAGCGNVKNKENDASTDMDKNYNFTEVLEKELNLDIKSKGETEVKVDFSAGRQNYVKIVLDNNVGLKGKICFEKEGDPSEKGEELFFIVQESGEPFYQIIDVRNKYDYAKKFTKIIFENVSEKDGQVKIKSLKIGKFSGETLPEVYISNDIYKLGISLNTGGGIDYLERINSGIVQVKKVNGEMAIGVDFDKKYPDATVIEREVNLVNKHDHGRNIQQAYYGTNKPPYVNGSYMGHVWGYNPVQGGDVGNNSSVMCDYKNDGKSVYIKIRPLDWAKKNEVTESYMENWYYFEDNMVVVKNRFTDFSGYVHDKKDQELPAFYGVAPLFRFAAARDGEIEYNDNVGWWGTQVVGINRWENLEESWYAWLNEDDYGIGVCVPDASIMIFGRTEKFSLYFNGSAQLNNSSTYGAILGKFAIKSYDTFTYTYYMCVDDVYNIHDDFKALESEITNDDILRYEGRTK